MKITILFATHNGAFTLPLMMESIIHALLPENCQLEIVAVCNACTDNSKAILEGFRERLNLVILNEPRPGKNIALNTGIKAVTGESVLVVDDDIIVDVNWLVTYARLFREKTEHDIFGGVINAHWIEAPPEGLTKAIPVEMAYALTSDDYTTGPIDATRLFGPNMAVRASVFEEGTLFDEDIGPASDNKNYVTGSETEFLKRAQRKGHSAYFSEDCRVDHIVRPWQLTQAWLNNRAYKGGKSTIEMVIGSNRTPPLVPTILGYPRWTLYESLKLRLKITYKRLVGFENNEEKYRMYWDLYAKLGYSAQYKKHFKSGVIA
ncbi:MAG: glycosyltransferase [Pseudomonadota bacterium]|nr:glycosyltransferase [Pseudomonadota bacterium]|tara:strand:+ start:3501 stop:4457 length:957 start_codon:yes stop_codon:yes gene_type:complete